jgi:hypothetical protein
MVVEAVCAAARCAAPGIPKPVPKFNGRTLEDWRLEGEELNNTQAELARMMRVMTIGQLTASIAHEVSQPGHVPAYWAGATFAFSIPCDSGLQTDSAS